MAETAWLSRAGFDRGVREILKEFAIRGRLSRPGFVAQATVVAKQSRRKWARVMRRLSAPTTGCLDAVVTTRLPLPRTASIAERLAPLRLCEAPALGAMRRSLKRHGQLTPLARRRCRGRHGGGDGCRLTDYFPVAGSEYPLDPAHEPDHKQHPAGTVPDPEKERIFTDLQKLRAARLVVPVGEEHMFYAAIRSKSCRLTPLGRFYWKRAKADLL